MAALKLKQALLTVSDKTDLLELGQALVRHGVEILATGGTAKMLVENEVPVTEVADFTGSDEILGGRVKTLHPRIFGSILYRRSDESQVAEAAEVGLGDLNLLVINLYPFEQVVKGPETPIATALENIDIGGHSLLRAGLKSFPHVVALTDPADYRAAVAEMDANNGELSEEFVRQQAQKALTYLTHYDIVIHRQMSRILSGDEETPQRINLELELKSSLRYGENPHQKASFYDMINNDDPVTLSNAKQLQGKELSYNNYLDLEAAMVMARDFTEPCVAILKHNNPCGLAVNDDICTAYRQALECDPVSAFGSVIGLNRVVDKALAELIDQTKFVEAVIAPGYSAEALELMKGKQNRRILELPGMEVAVRETQPAYRCIRGGCLVQDEDALDEKEYSWKTVTERKPSAEEEASLRFAFRAAKQVKSNAIVLVNGTATVGVGAGQMSRVDSSRIAVSKAGEKAKGSALGSDAFFPFRDGIDAAAEAGITSIVQPGGSKGDDEVIAACNEHGIAMIFTGKRHFRH